MEVVSAFISTLARYPSPAPEITKYLLDLLDASCVVPMLIAYLRNDSGMKTGPFFVLLSFVVVAVVVIIIVVVAAADFVFFV